MGVSMDVRKLIFLVLAGCGGDVFVAGDGGTGSDGGGSSVCPASPPTAGTSCTAFKGMDKCEYGTNPDPSCNQIFACPSGTWMDQSTGTICPSQQNCPGQYSDVQVGQDCSNNTLSCAYPQGECICTQSPGGLVSQTPVWACFTPSGCPEPRPDIGTACTTQGTTCNYGACSGGVELVCNGTSWQEALSGVCPK